MSRNSTGLSRDERKRSVVSTDDLDSLMDVNLVCAFFSNKSKMTIFRWLNDPVLGFPKPIRIAGMNYWSRRQLLDFVERESANPKRKPPNRRLTSATTGLEA